MRVDYIPYQPTGNEVANKPVTPQRQEATIALPVTPVPAAGRVMRDMPVANADPSQPLPGQKAQRAYGATAAMGQEPVRTEGFDLFA